MRPEKKTIGNRPIIGRPIVGQSIIGAPLTTSLWDPYGDASPPTLENLGTYCTWSLAPRFATDSDFFAGHYVWELIKRVLIPPNWI